MANPQPHGVQATPGMNRDLTPAALPQGASPYLLNAALPAGSGAPLVTNEPSTMLASMLPPGWVVIGQVAVPAQERLLLFLAPQLPPLAAGTDEPLSGFATTGGMLAQLTDVRIDRGIDPPASAPACADCLASAPLPALETLSLGPMARLTVLLQHPGLNFNPHHPIDAQVRLDDCRLRLYWVDGYNPDRYLYFKYSKVLDFRSPLVLDSFFQLPGTTELNLNRIRMQPLLSRLRISTDAVVAGGSLPAGTYRYMAAYADATGHELTDYEGLTTPLPLSTRRITEETDYNTGQAIQLRVLADTGLYSYYNLAVLQLVDGVLTTRLLGTFPTNQSQVIHTGSETGSALPVSVLLSRRTHYESSKGLAQTGDKLFKWGLREWAKPNLQRVVNNIPLRWATTSMPEGSYRNGVVAARTMGYPRDEIIAVGLVFEYDTGEDSCVLHLPGRPPAPAELAPAPDNADRLAVQTDCDPGLPAYWQVYNTASVQTRPHQPYDPCADTIWETGDMGYWQSSLRYPQDPLIWGELAGAFIRHHRLPDAAISPFHDGTGELGFGAQNTIYPLGLLIDTADVLHALADGVRRGYLSEADRVRIKSYRVVRADRTGQASILAKGLLYDVGSYEKDDRTVYYANYPYNDLRPDPYLAPEKNTYDSPDYGGGRTSPRDCDGRAGVQCEYRLEHSPSGRYTFHSPEHHFLGRQTGLTGDRLVLETLETGESEGYFEEAKGQAHYRFLSTFASILAAAAGIALFYAKDDDIRKVDTESVPPQATARVTYGEPASRTASTSQPLSAVSSYAASTQAVPTFGNTFVSETLSSGEPTVSTTQTGIIDLITDAIGSIVKTAIKLASPSSIIQLMQEIALMREILTALTPYHNFALQHNSVGRYVNSLPVVNGVGSKIRALGSIQFLTADWQDVDDNPQPITGRIRTFRPGNILTDLPALARDLAERKPRQIRFNNWHRESATYLRIRGRYLPRPVREDLSRYVAAEVTDEDNLSKRIYAPISSYYGSVKANRPDLFGAITTIRYLETGQGSLRLSSYEPAGITWGGDTTIGRFSLKRKHSFFTQTRFKAATGTDVKYERLGNVAYPNYYLNTLGGLLDGFDASNVFQALGAVVSSSFGAAKNRFDLDSTGSKIYFQKGYMYLYSYGVPSFLCESSINLDLRHGREGQENSFYGATTDLSTWLQQENVEPAIDNQYFYNPIYSRTPLESSLCSYGPNFRPGQRCRQIHPNRIQYSLTSADALVETSSFDRWLTFRPNDIHDVGESLGLLTGVDGIAGDRLLVRQTLGSRLYGGMLRLDTNQQPLQLGAGELFAQAPQEYIRTDTGYAGSAHRALLRTPYGIITIDSRNRKIFQLDPTGGGLKDLTEYGMLGWFDRYLGFRLAEQFPHVSTDNPLTGAGLVMGYDPRQERVLITKRDYICRDMAVEYDPVYGQFFRTAGGRRQVVSLDDPRYFTAAHWTVGYYFRRQAWVYYSFVPRAYLQAGPLLASYADGGLWLHGATQRSFQVFYGKTYPFVVDVPLPAGGSSRLQNVQFRQLTRRHRGDGSHYLLENEPFRWGVLWGPSVCSGQLSLVPATGTRRDLSPVRYRPDYFELDVYRSRTGLWSLNGFRDASRPGATAQPVWLWSAGGSERTLNRDRVQYGAPGRESASQHLVQPNLTLTLTNVETRFEYQLEGVLTDQAPRIPT